VREHPASVKIHRLRWQDLHLTATATTKLSTASPITSPAPHPASCPSPTWYPHDLSELETPASTGFNLSEKLQTLAQIDAFEKDYLSKFTIWAPTLTQEVILAQIEGLRDRAYDTGERYVVKGSGLGYPAFHGMKGWTATARFMPRLVKGGKGSEVWKGSAIWWDGNGYVASSSEK
jgi:hypothetical protein